MTEIQIRMLRLVSNLQQLAAKLDDLETEYQELQRDLSILDEEVS